MSEDLIQRVTKVIATSKRIPLETVTIDSEFVQLGIDSMDAVEILFALEGEFDISIPDEEVRSVRNVRDMCAGVERLVAAKNADAPAGKASAQGSAAAPTENVAPASTDVGLSSGATPERDPQKDPGQVLAVPVPPPAAPAIRSEGNSNHAPEESPVAKAETATASTAKSSIAKASTAKPSTT